MRSIGRGLVCAVSALTHRHEAINDAVSEEVRSAARRSSAPSIHVGRLAYVLRSFDPADSQSPDGKRAVSTEARSVAYVRRSSVLPMNKPIVHRAYKCA
jgi:hypothetical protein